MTGPTRNRLPRVLVTLALLALGGFAVVVWLLARPEHVRQDQKPSPKAVPAPSATGGERDVRLEKRDWRPAPALPASPEDVIANPDCRIAVGEGSARDVTVVVVPTASGAWYAVVGHDGVIFDGTLSFQPDRHAFGKRPDGTVVAGFGRDGKVRVFHDGQLTYELDSAWDFDVAADGSTFYAIEPLTGAARLVVRNIDLGEEHHYELDDSLVPSGSERNFGTSYSTDFGEIIVSSLRGGLLSPGTPAAKSWAANGVVFSFAPMASAGVQWFFRVDGGAPRTVTVETTERGAFFPRESVVFASSETGYDVRFEDGVGWKIVKVNVDYGEEGRVSTAEEIWSRHVSHPDSTPLMPPVLSRDGAWLGVLGTEFEILDTTTGKPVASFSEEEDVWDLGAEFRGDQLLSYRREEDGSVAVYAIDLDGAEDGPNRVVVRLGHGPAVPETVGGILNDYALEFDWDRTPGPSSRLAVCSEDVPLLGALGVQDGRLTFEAGSGTEYP